MINNITVGDTVIIHQTQGTGVVEHIDEAAGIAHIDLRTGERIADLKKI